MGSDFAHNMPESEVSFDLFFHVNSYYFTEWSSSIGEIC